MASQNLFPQSIKTYLAGIRHMQITLRLPEPREFSSLSRLKLVQAGIKQVMPSKLLKAKATHHSSNSEMHSTVVEL